MHFCQRKNIAGKILINNLKIYMYIYNSEIIFMIHYETNDQNKFYRKVKTDIP